MLNVGYISISLCLPVYFCLMCIDTNQSRVPPPRPPPPSYSNAPPGAPQSQPSGILNLKVNEKRINYYLITDVCLISRYTDRLFDIHV